MPSIVFDVVLLAGGTASFATLKASGEHVLFVREAYKHAKSIAALGAVQKMLPSVGILGRPSAASKPSCVLVAESELGVALANAFLGHMALHRHRTLRSHVIAPSA